MSVHKTTTGAWRVRWRDETGRNRSKVLGRKRDAEAFDAEVTTAQAHGRPRDARRRPRDARRVRARSGGWTTRSRTLRPPRWSATRATWDLHVLPAPRASPGARRDAAGVPTVRGRPGARRAWDRPRTIGARAARQRAAARRRVGAHHDESGARRAQAGAAPRARGPPAGASERRGDARRPRAPVMRRSSRSSHTWVPGQGRRYSCGGRTLVTAASPSARRRRARGEYGRRASWPRWAPTSWRGGWAGRRRTGRWSSPVGTASRGRPTTGATGATGRSLLRRGPADSPGVRPYDLRHSAASLWLHEGRSVVEIAAVAGPRKPTMTSRHLRRT